MNGRGEVDKRTTRSSIFLSGVDGRASNFVASSRQHVLRKELAWPVGSFGVLIGALSEERQDLESRVVCLTVKRKRVVGDSA